MQKERQKMKNRRYKPANFESISVALRNMKTIAKKEGGKVEVIFNSTKITVSANSNLKFIQRQWFKTQYPTSWRDYYPDGKNFGPVWH